MGRDLNTCRSLSSVHRRLPLFDFCPFVLHYQYTMRVTVAQNVSVGYSYLPYDMCDRILVLSDQHEDVHY